MDLDSRRGVGVIANSPATQHQRQSSPASRRGIVPAGPGYRPTLSQAARFPFEGYLEPDLDPGRPLGAGINVRSLLPDHP